MSQSTEAKTNFPEILPVVEQYLEDCKASGKPMRINLWDTNHFINEPTHVLADTGLHDVAQKYGSPLYVLEMVSGADVNKKFGEYLYGDKKQKSEVQELLDKKMSDRNTRQSDFKQIFEYAKHDVDSNSPNPTRLYFPDPREEDAKAVISSMPKDEQDILKKFQRMMQEEVDKGKASGDGVNSQQQVMQVIAPKVIASFSDTEKQTLVRATKKLSSVAFGSDLMDTSAIDEKIASGVDSHFNRYSPAQNGNDVQITFYGAGHSPVLKRSATHAIGMCCHGKTVCSPLPCREG